MPAVHATILSMPVPSLEDVIKIDPLALDRPMTVTQASEFCGINPDAMRSMQRRNQGPKFTRPKNLKKLMTTPRLCLVWLTDDNSLAKKARAKISGADRC